MKNKKTFNILTNIILLIAFLLTYFLDLTGLDWHQYLGVAVGVFMILHVILHAHWIGCISKRFFTKLSAKIRLDYVLDLVLLIAITLIVITGIAISTWLNISNSIYPIIRDIHIIASIAGLIFLTVKLALHWKYFVNLASKLKIKIPKAAQPVFTAAQRDSRLLLSRREALKTIGIFSIVGVAGLYKAVDAMAFSSETTVLPDPKVAIANIEANNIANQDVFDTTGAETTPETSQETSASGQRRRRGQGESVTVPEMPLPEPVQPTGTPIPQASATPFQPTQTPSLQDCIIQCPRGCAYPGQCRRYIDQNGNNLCDLGECLLVKLSG